MVQARAYLSSPRRSSRRTALPSLLGMAPGETRRTRRPTDRALLRLEEMSRCSFSTARTSSKANSGFGSTFRVTTSRCCSRVSSIWYHEDTCGKVFITSSIWDGKTAAGALARDDAGDVARAVAHDRGRLAVDGGEHELAPLAVRQDLAGLGVDDLGEEVVLGEVQALLLHALDGHARSHRLGEAVDVEHGVTELLLELGAEVVREGLGAVDAGTQVELLLRVDAHRHRRVGDVHGVGGRAAQNRGAHLAQDANLALGVARADGDNRAARHLGAVVRAEAAGEQAVAVADLADVVLAAVGVPDAAREAVAPELQVVLGVAAHGRDAGGAAGHVDLADVLHRHREELVGIVVT